MVDAVVVGKEVFVFLLQHGVSLRIGHIANLALCHGGVGLAHKLHLVGIAELHPIPVADGVVDVVGDVVDEHGLIGLQLGLALTAYRLIVSIEVGLDVLDGNLAMRGGRDGEGDVHRLAIGVGRTRVGRDVLVVDIDATLDVPIVCGCSVLALIFSGSGVAVVDNLLCTVDEVTRGLKLLERRVVGVGLIGACASVVGRKDGLREACIVSCAMFVLCIDIATTQTGHDVDKVELNHTGDEAPVFLCGRASLGGQFQEHT